MVNFLLKGYGVASLGIIHEYVALDDYECERSRLVIETALGYVLAEWYGGFLSSGMYVYGEFHSYGMKKVYDNLSDAIDCANNLLDINSKATIWIDDYWASESEAIKWCY